MCTSIVANGKKTIVGWNLDILDMEYRVVPEKDKVYIAVNDKTEGWMPLFGANIRGDFVTMPTCWPYDGRSDPAGEDQPNIIMLNIDLLLMKKTFAETRAIAETGKVCSVPGLTFQSQLSDAHGNVLQITPGQCTRYLPSPDHAIMTNFSPCKGNSEQHPWMGWDRYCTAENMLKNRKPDFGVYDCFEVLKNTSQTVCPTVVSMVFYAAENTVYWCEDRKWDKIEKYKMG